MTSQQPEHRLLGVFAHPDDETIGAGGLLALAVETGFDVSVVTCTRGERGEVIPPELAHLAAEPDALARQRETELSSALAELGVHRHLFLDQVPGLEDQRPARFRDSGMRWVRPGVAGPGQDAGPEAFTAVDLDVAALLLAIVMRHVRPTAVLTEEPGGGYGHPDHVHAHHVTMRAVQLAAGEDPELLPGLVPWRVPTVLWVAQEERHLRDAVAELRDTLAGHEPRRAPDGTVLTVLDDVAELPPIAVPAEAVTASFDVRPVAERLIAALRRHRTQVQAVAPIAGRRIVGHLGLSNAALVPVLDRVYLRAAPGYDAGAVAAVLTDARNAGGSVPAAPIAFGSGTTTDLGAPGSGTTADPAYFGAPGSGTTADPAYSGAPGSGTPPDAGRSDTPGSGVTADPGLPTGPTGTLAPEQSTALVRSTGPASTAHVGHAGTDRREADRGAKPRGPIGRLATGGGVTGALVAVLAGVVMAMLGTVVHRYTLEGWPVGIALGLAGVLAAAVAARAIAGGGGLLLTALAVVLTTQAMAFLRPGGDVLVTNELVSYLWLFGAPIICISAAFLPRRWFADGRTR